MRILLVLAALLLAMPAHAQLIIAHRGASGERPEHTLAAYEKAIDEGADFVEPDLVPTKDMVLVARHDTELSDTTDVASHAEFADRRRTKEVDGEKLTGWFVEDFTLTELRTLRTKERLPGVRPANARFDGLWQVPTFAEIVTLVRAKEAETGRTVGIYPELKHPTFLLQDAGIDVVDLFVRDWRDQRLDGKSIPLFVQCFEVGPLQRLHKMTDLPLVQLVADKGGPADELAMTYAAMLSPTGLAEVAKYAAVIAPEATQVVGADGKPTALVGTGHGTGLKVHAWVLRKENAFLPPPLRKGEDPRAVGDYAAAWNLLTQAGVDGVFTDDPALANKARQPVR
jgi:glycerophosphoryl diester phosphodiesterase